MSARTTLLLAVLVASFVNFLHADDWWQFRGPGGNGDAGDEIVPTKWGGFFDKPCWETTIPGHGWSSPVVVANRIWITTSELVALNEIQSEDKIAKRPFGVSDFQTHASVKLFAIELNANTGEMLRRIELFECDDPPPIHSSNSYASPTPVSDGKRVYCHFGALGTACIEIETGRVLWRREFNVEEITGCAASPVLWRDMLYLACDGADQQFVVALDTLSGKTKWKTDRPSLEGVDPAFRRSFSTPLIVESNPRTQLISMSAQWLVAYNPENGQEWWRAKVGSGYSAVPRPVFQGDKVFVSTGYSKPQMVAVNINGTGDITDTHIVWRSISQGPEISSPILVGGQIYFVSAIGIATSLDLETGEMVWQHRVGGSHASSPTYAGGHIYFTSKEGVTTVIRPGREYDEIGKNELFGETYASLAVYQNHFLLRTNPILYCLETVTLE